MINDIKEIIDEIKSYENEDTCLIVLSQKENKALLNYITNLQNEIFDLKDTIQNKNDCIGAYECIIEDRDKRIDKAIEYCNNNIEFTPRLIDVIDILRGDE